MCVVSTRSTFVIDENGRFASVIMDFKPKGVPFLLDDLKKLGQKL